MRSRFFAFFLALVSMSLFPCAVSADTVRQIIFPVAGDYTFRDDFHEPRGGGTRLHLGNDVIAAKMTPLVAVVDGYISFVARPEARWGYEVEIQDSEGYTYDYLHVNNDTPGTDNGAGGEAYAYPAGIQRGATVARGTVIGWVGDSGNAEETVPHLHFEIRDPNHEPINPFPSLAAASGGKGISANAPRPNTIEPTLEERKVELRYIFTKDMSEGAESNDVRQLQLVLKAAGHFTHPTATGYYGPITATSVSNYQKKKNIPATGIVNYATRKALNSDLGTYDPNMYEPFYSPAEQKALEIARLLQQIAALQKQLELLRNAGL